MEVCWFLKPNTTALNVTVLPPGLINLVNRNALTEGVLEGTRGVHVQESTSQPMAGATGILPGSLF